MIESSHRVRLDSLTGIRALAAVVVFGIHINYLFRNSHRFALLNEVTRQGRVGVSLFFILSGFVMAWSYRKGDTARAFYQRRAARIVPAYLAALAIALLVMQDENGFGSVRGVGQALFGATLLQAWVPSDRWYSGGNIVGWSLSTEVFFYLLFPFIIRPFLRLTDLGRAVLAAFCVAVVVAVPLIAHPAAIVSGTRPGVAFWSVLVFPPTRLAEFLIGMILATTFREGHRLGVPVWLAALFAGAGYLAAGIVPSDLSYVTTTLVPFSVLIYACAEADRDGRPSPLRARWLVRLGVWSYAFYLVHQLVIRVFAHNVLDHPVPVATRALVVAVAFVIGWVAAYGLFRVVEQPAERRLRARPATAAIPAQRRGRHRAMADLR